MTTTVAPSSASGGLWQREAALWELLDSRTPDRLMVIERDGRDSAGERSATDISSTSATD